MDMKAPRPGGGRKFARVASRRGACDLLQGTPGDDLRRGDTFVAMHWGSAVCERAGANDQSLTGLRSTFQAARSGKHAAVRVERVALAWRKSFTCLAAADAQRAASAPSPASITRRCRYPGAALR